MGFENFDQALVFSPVLFEALQFITAGPKCAGWRVAKGADRRIRILPGIDQVFCERTNNPVAAGINLADFSILLAGGFNYASSGGIDDGGYAAGLSIKSIFYCHLFPLII